MSKPVEVTDDTFDKFTKEHPIVVVDCWAPWCGPCKMIGPIIDQIAADMEGKIVFGKLNVDENQEIPTRLGVRSIPTLIVIKDGKEAERIVGFNAKNALTAKLEAHL